MNKSIMLSDIPKEVQVVWVYQMAGQPVGLKTMEMIKETMKKYPEYFPEEVKQKPASWLGSIEEKHFEELRKDCEKYIPKSKS